MAARMNSFLAVALGVLLWGLSFGTPLVAAAEPFEAPEFRGAFGPDGTSETDYDKAGPSAVDPVAKVVYVADKSADVLYKFKIDGPEGFSLTPLDWGATEPYISGHEITGLSMPNGFWEGEVAVDPSSHIVYVTSGNAVRAFQENGEPAEFTEGPGMGSSEIGGFGELLGVAVDANGNIYASDYTTGLIKIYASTGEFITQIESEHPAILGVGPDGSLYELKYNGGVKRWVPSEYPVTSSTIYTATSIVENADSHYYLAVDSSSGIFYIPELKAETGGEDLHISAYGPSGEFLGSFAGPGEEGALKRGNQGISVNSATGTVYASTDDNTFEGTFSKVEVFAPEPVVPGPPTVLGTSVGGVTSNTATLESVINPNTFDTTYFFEYGLEDCAAPGSSCSVSPVLPVSIGSGHKAVSVAQDIAGLQADTTYHYRVIAQNVEGVTKGPDRQFITQSNVLNFEQPDSRVWEMVSPSDKGGGVLGASFNPGAGIIQAAVNGDGLIYQSINSVESDPDGSRSVESSTVLARRVGSSWQSKDITAPHTRATNLSNNVSEYNLFSLDLSKGLLEPRDSTPLSEATSERAPHLRENTEPPVYTPLVTSKEGFANVPAGTKFGGNEPGAPVSDVYVRGATPDLTHIVLTSDPPLVDNALIQALYLWHAGQLQAVSVLPDGETEEGSSIVRGILGSGPQSVQNAISDDGSRVFWGRGNVDTSGVKTSSLYVYVAEEDKSYRLDVAQSGATESSPAAPAFQAASDDGEKVFFTDSRQLTEDASPNGRDLYRCVIPEGAEGCSSLTDISAPLDNATESAEVQGMVSGMSDDGTRVFFVALGALTAGANQRGESAVSGEPNLYLWEEGEGLRFIATLSEEDDRDWGKVEGETPGYMQNMSASASPSGRYLAFMSNMDLTGLEGGSVERAEQVFRFDAETDALTCASCDPSGAEATGQVSPPRLMDRQGIWEGRRVAAMLPALLASGGAQFQPYPLHPPRSVLDNGRIYFHAVEPLVSGDSNGDWDVYQYEATGTGDCAGVSKGKAIAGSAGGCVSLISSGAAPGPSAFLDASVSGDDVFFLSRGRLSVTDEDDVYDVYDARVNGVAAVRQPQGECAGQDCRPFSAPPAAPPSASEGFNGPGNVHQAHKRCAKGKHKVRRKGKVRCVPKKHQAHKRAAGNGRRAVR
jgi:hypothetical protein